MNYQHPQLGIALGWKHNHAPGIFTQNGILMAWPGMLGPVPTKAAQAQAVTDYQAYLASTACKDDDLQQFMDSIDGKVMKALALVMIDKGVCTLADLKAKYRIL